MSERVEQFQSEMLNNMADALTAAQSRVAELEKLLTRCLPVLNKYDCELDADELYDEVRKVLRNGK